MQGSSTWYRITEELATTVMQSYCPTNRFCYDSVYEQFPYQILLFEYLVLILYVSSLLKILTPYEQLPIPVRQPPPAHRHPPPQSVGGCLRMTLIETEGSRLAFRHFTVVVDKYK